MFEQIFFKLLENSIQASFFILAILLVRLCFKRMPRQYICVLWALLALRLLLPVHLTSSFSLVPDTSRLQTFTEQLSVVTPPETDKIPPVATAPTPVPVIPDTVPSDITTVGTPQPDVDRIESVITVPAATTAPAQKPTVTAVLSVIWLFGALLLPAYAAVSYLLLKRKLREAVHDTDNIWYAGNIPAAFVLGYVKPRIYIPYSVPKEELPYIIAHEKAHISHRDYLSKLLGYLILSLYWFHPLVWIAYLSFCKDLEITCDERVITQLGDEKRKAYSQALLACSVSNRDILQSPLAFSELGVKERITGILHYKKPGFFGIVLTVIVCLAVCICFMTNPKDSETETETSLGTETVSATDFLQQIADESHDYWCDKLLAEKKITSADALYTYGNPLDGELSFGKELELVHTYYTLNENYVATIYTTTWTYERSSDEIHVLETSHQAYETVTTAADMDTLFSLYPVSYVKTEGSDDSEALDSLVTEAFLAIYNSGNDNAADCPLLKADLALETLMHFDGGSAEILPADNDNSCIVAYTFADGTQAAYTMYRQKYGTSTDSQGLYWFPRWKCSDTEVAKYRTSQTYLEQATADDLEQVTDYFDFALYQDTLPDTYSPDAFFILAEIPDEQVTLYGLKNGIGMLIKDRDMLYKLHAEWLGGYASAPSFYKQDYDKDGVTEYALQMITGTGTGCYLEEITLLEPEGNSLRMQTFDGRPMESLYEASVKDHILTITTAHDSCTLDLSGLEADNACTYTDADCGSINAFTEADGQWWYSAKIGFLTADSVAPTYDCDISLVAPVYYYNDKYFEFGDISILVDASESYGLYASEAEQRNFNGFIKNVTSDTAVSEYIYEYFDAREDLSITINASGNYGMISHNGKKLEIETYGAFYQKDSSEYALPYLMDVTGDGVKELLLVYSSYPVGDPYAEQKCFVYRLDTMEEIPFVTDTTDLSRLLTLTPISYDKEASTLIFEVSYDQSIHENLIEADRAPYQTSANIEPDMATYWTQKHSSYILPQYDSLSFRPWDKRFTASFTVYLDASMTYDRFFPFYVDYIWDEASGSFIMDLSTAYIQAAG